MDYRDRYEALTGRSLRQWFSCHDGNMHAPARVFSDHQPDLIPAPGRLGVSSPAHPPLDIRAAFSFGVVGKGDPVDGRGADEVLGTCIQREGGDP